MVTVAKEAKILGVRWTTPRYYRGKMQMFSEDSKIMIKKLKEIRQKLKRIKAFQQYMD